LFSVITAYISLPLAIGRYTTQSFATENDIYSILLGFFILTISTKIISFVFSPISHINILQWVLVSLKILILGILLVVFVPFLIGLLIDLIFFVPIMVSYDESSYIFIHLGDIIQHWCLGALMLKFWYRWITGTNNDPNNIRNNVLEDLDQPRGDRWIDRFEQLKGNGFLNVDFKFTLFKIIFPILHYPLTLFTVPYCFARGIVPLFGGSLILENIALRYGFSVYCFILISERLFHKTKQWINHFHNIIRDDKYLIGKHLHNLENSNQSSLNNINININNNINDDDELLK